MGHSASEQKKECLFQTWINLCPWHTQMARTAGWKHVGTGIIIAQASHSLSLYGSHSLLASSTFWRRRSHTNGNEWISQVRNAMYWASSDGKNAIAGHLKWWRQTIRGTVHSHNNITVDCSIQQLCNVLLLAGCGREMEDGSARVRVWSVAKILKG